MSDGMGRSGSFCSIACEAIQLSLRRDSRSMMRDGHHSGIYSMKLSLYEHAAFPLSTFHVRPGALGVHPMALGWIRGVIMNRAACCVFRFLRDGDCVGDDDEEHWVVILPMSWMAQ